MRRRDLLTGIAAAAAATQLGAQAPVTPTPRKGRVKQGVMRVNFDPKMSFEDVCKIAAQVGCVGVDLAGPNDWPMLKKYGLICTMASQGAGVTFENGIIRKEMHADLEKSVGAQIDTVAAGGFPNMIMVGGQRRGMSYEEGADAAVAFFNRVKTRAEDRKVNICLEMMNSRYTDAALGRVDQICDHLSWGVDVMKRVNSPRIKLLCDIYHLQIADGNVVENIRNNIQYIGHFHTGGVPGRHEIDDTQELNYRYIAQEIVKLGFTGFVSHEYRLTTGKDSAKELDRAVSIMDV